MLGPGLQLGRSRGEDRFYNPAKARRHFQDQHSDQLRRAQSDGAATPAPPVKENKYIPPGARQNGIRKASASPQEPPKQAAVANPEPKPSPLPPPPLPPANNLECFLEAITPSVPAQYLSKTTVRGWRTRDVDFQPYFLLGELWESFKEWSAYGAGVPLILNESDSVVQYYVPYLSGIQIFGDSVKSSAKLRRMGEDSDGDYYRDSSSDGSSDCEPERAPKFQGEQWNRSHVSSDNSIRMDRLSLRDQHAALQDEFSSDDGESGASQGCLLFEYLERDPPYGREPLADKISDLARRFPELKNLRSCDVLSSSWISVAWYPIYRIPTGPTLKDLEACFLTFHSLHTPMRGAQDGHAPLMMAPTEVDGVPKICLPVFGLASYKFRGSLWTRDGENELKLASALFQAADSWLRMLQVDHPDFQFFSRVR